MIYPGWITSGVLHTPWVGNNEEAGAGVHPAHARGLPTSRLTRAHEGMPKIAWRGCCRSTPTLWVGFQGGICMYPVGEGDH